MELYHLKIYIDDLLHRAVGASEAGFLGIYQFLFPESYLNSAMLLSRGVSFYLFVLITGIVVIINNYKIMKNKNRS